MKIQMKVTGRRQIKTLARRFREAADGQLQRDLNAELVRAAPPVLARTRSTVQGAAFPVAPPAGGSDGTAFRAGLAAATEAVPLSNGVRFRVDGAAVGRGSRGHRLAMLSDTELAPRWRHPVHGNRERWVTQLGMPWFFSSIRPEEPRFASGVGQAMDKTIRRIAG